MPLAELTARDEALARATAVHVVWYVYVEEDEAGTDVTWGIPVAAHATSEAAQADLAVRRSPPLPEGNPNGKYLCDAPCNLLAFVQTLCGGDADVVRAVLRGEAASLRPQVWYSPGYYRQYIGSAPLLADERRRACALNVWIVYYEDRFHVGPSRQTHPVAVCLTEAEATAEVLRRGPIEPGFDGHLVVGPSPLLTEQTTTSALGADVIREVLRRVAARECGPIPVA